MFGVCAAGLYSRKCELLFDVGLFAHARVLAAITARLLTVGLLRAWAADSLVDDNWVVVQIGSSDNAHHHKHAHLPIRHNLS